jgi:putative ABC transport system substrate-binding protein
MKVNPIAWSLALVLTLGLAAPFATEAQQAGKVYRIAFLGEGSTLEPRYQGALEEALRQLGYIPGRRVILEYRYAGGDPERLRQQAAELVQLPVDIILTQTNPATAAAKQATQTIPVVMVTATNVMQTGFVQSLGRPGGNITGLTADPAPETILGKQLGVLREFVPKLSRMGVLWNSSVPGYRQYFDTLQEQARQVGIDLQSLEVQSPTMLETAFATGRQQRAEALFIFVDVLTFVHRRAIVELAIKNRLPTVAYVKEFAEAGGLVTYGIDLTELFRRAAYYVDISKHVGRVNSESIVVDEIAA